MKTIRIDGVIGDWLNTGEEFQFRLQELGLEPGEELLIILNSPGGSVIDGFNIYNQIKSLDNPTTIKIEGFAASIAALISMAADKIQMSEVGQFMIHRASVFLEGNKTELEKQAEILQSIDATQISVFSAKTGLDNTEIEQMLDKETWMTAEEAKKLGFVDEIVDRIEAKMAAIYYQSIKGNKMKWKELLEKMAGVKAETPEINEVVVTEETSDETSEETPEEALNAVTREEFDELKQTIQDLLKALMEKEKAEGEEKTVEEVISEVVKTELEALIKRLPRSNGQPEVPQETITRVPQYSDRYEKWRNDLKEIEAKTRLS